jgi:hypothetical protein
MLAAIRRASSRVSWRPLIEYACSLSERQSDTRPMRDRALEYRAGSTETVAGIEQAIDLRSVPRPLLDFVEVAIVGVDRAIGHLMKGDVIGFRFGHGENIARS